MASVKPGIFVKNEADPTAKANVIAMDISSLKTAKNTLKPVSICVTEPKGVPIEKADVVIVGGFGIGDQKNWDMIAEIATLLGGAAGCTRPTVDAGWAPGEHVMIGTSGKSIRPKNYIGFGISGATHHICGMKDSGLVINVNTDEKASIFDVSDFCVVGDLNKILPELLEQVKASKKAASCTF
ncbi:Caffeyl-CoA reductase-Etf complex subunit CarE [bioreactor metagenome]|uniref:Caffeyl-CoA reductase-Etf complex subunit CarE n=1 Tax=bioreactor metagenome TaxID=1076179 RepID=A0A645GF27_9ZZZZ